ncbi:MAG TPA: universal stress protein [Nitrososphaeraceae archaeon]|nr:universal stress protein [Nitrososphaeraceae archaeon]
MTQKILVPHDGSEMSDRALNKAVEFAKLLKSEIILLHILDDKLVPSGAIMSLLGEKSGTVRDAKLRILQIVRIGAEQLLKERTEKVRKNGINVRFIVGMGPPADGIANVAKNENVDLIIIGSKELEKENNDKLKLLGSVTRRVSEISECPVMIVKR